MSEPADKPLTPKEAAFVAEYLIDLNAAGAAERAGYSARTAKQIAYGLMQKPHVKTAIDAALAERAERAKLTADEVLIELARIARSDLRRAFDADGRLKAIGDLDEDTARTLASVEVVTRRVPGQGDDGAAEVEYVHKIKGWDKIAALTLAAKHLGLVTERREHSGPGGGPIQTEGKTTVDVSGLSDDQLRALASIRVLPG